MKRAVLIVALALSIPANALAIPGQTAAQLAAWGKANPALQGFTSSMDQETAGTNYTAKVRIDGLVGNFSAEPQDGIVHREYVAFSELPETWSIAAHKNLIADVLTKVYGKAIAADFSGAALVRGTGKATIWQGARFGYAASAQAIFVVRLADLPGIVKNAKAGGGIDDSD